MVQATLDEELEDRDWGLQQVLTSANWGGVVGNFMTGGLNLQVHLGMRPESRALSLVGTCALAVAPAEHLHMQRHAV